MKRELEMLNLIIQRNDYITIDELATFFGVTNRTVRDDLLMIEDYLKDSKIEIIRNRTLGVAIKRNEFNDEDLLKVMVKIQEESDYYSATERENIIFQTLFLENEKCTINSLCEKTKSSRATVVKDFAKVEQWLKSRNITIEKRPHYGMRIIYKESDWRKAVLDYINKYFKEINFEKLYANIRENELFILSMSVNDFINRFIENVNLKVVKNFVRKYENDKNLRFTDEAFVNVFMYILISMQRVKQKKSITVNDVTLKDAALMQSIDEWVKENAKVLNYSEDINMNSVEMESIACYMLTQNKRYGTEIIESSIYDEEYLISKFIDTVQNFLSVNLSEDENLFNSLLMHIRPTIHRLLFDIVIENPLKDEIKALYPEIFNACKVGCELFYKQLGKFPNEDEISYLTMHIAASIEKRKKEKTLLNFFRVIVVCSSGIGTSNMLYVRLLNEFPNLIIESICSVEELRRVNKEGIDFIISTTPLSLGTESSVIYVSPLLNQTDIAQIKKYMRKSVIKVKDGHNFIVDDLMSIISQECDIPDYSKLYKLIHQYFDKTEEVLNDDSPKLSDLLYEKHIRLNVKVKDWKEAIGVSGELLHMDGCVERRYIYSMIDAKEIMGEGIVISKGVAFPHANPNDGVKKLCMSFVTLKEPIVFGNKEYDPVRVIVGLGALKSMSHLKALSELFEIIADKEFFDELCLKDNVDDFRKALMAFEDNLKVK